MPPQGTHPRASRSRSTCSITNTNTAAEDAASEQAIVPGGKPVKNHPDRDTAWDFVRKELDKVIARLRKRK